jgi:PAS domain S-box-containing protein
LAERVVVAPETFLHEIQAVNEQLLIAGLREQTLAEQLGRQLAFTTAITSSLVEGVYVVDTAGRCTFVNPAAEQMLGWTSAELHGKDVSVVIPLHAPRGASHAAAPVPLRDVIRFGVTQRNEEAVFRHRGGGRFPTAYSVAPILMDGQVVGAVITFRDMSDVRGYNASAKNIWRSLRMICAHR